MLLATCTRNGCAICTVKGTEKWSEHFKVGYPEVAKLEIKSNLHFCGPLASHILLALKLSNTWIFSSSLSQCVSNPRPFRRLADVFSLCVLPEKQCQPHRHWKLGDNCLTFCFIKFRSKMTLYIQNVRHFARLKSFDSTLYPTNLAIQHCIYVSLSLSLALTH